MGAYVCITDTPPRTQLRKGALVDVETKELKPLGMDDVSEGFCEKIRRILRARDMVNVDDTAIDTIANKMRAQVDVLHTRMGVGIMGTRDGSLVVAVQNRRAFLRET